MQRQLGFSLTQTDYFFSLFAVFNVIVNVFLIGRISARLGDRTMSNVGLASLVAAFATLPFVHDLTVLAATMAFFRFGMALVSTGITALISNAATDREQGTVLGTSSSLDSLSGILAPPVSTGLLTSLGPAYAGVEPLSLVAIALVMGLAGARSEQSADGAPTGLAGEIETAQVETLQ